MRSFPIQGLVAATHTPFRQDGSLRLEVIERQAGHLISNQVGYAFICGTTGESHSLTLQERSALAERWMEVARGSALKVIVHVGGNCLTDAQSLARQAQTLGAAAVSALAPSYFKPKSITALVECCAAVASSCPDLPFFYYDIPSWTGVAFPMAEFLERAAERIPNLAGLKFTNGDLMMFQQCLRSCSGKMSVTWGCDEYLLAALALGAEGAIGSTYNFAAPIYTGLLEAFRIGDLRKAREAQYRSVQLISLLSQRGYLPAAKALMQMLGVEVGPPRLPSEGLTVESRAALQKDLEILGFFDWVLPSRS